MKIPAQTILLKCLAGLVLCGWLAAPASAATVTWDANGATAGVTDGGGTWDTSTATWWNGATDVVWPNGTGDGAIIGNANGAAGTIALSGPINVNNITFNAPGSGNYTVSSSTLTLAGTTPTITANNDATISSAVAGSAGLVKTGAGVLTLSSSASTYTGNTTVNAGTLSLNTAQNVATMFAVAPTAAAGTMTIDGGNVTKTGNNDYFVVGYTGGAGTLNVTNNGYLSVGVFRGNWNGAANSTINLSSGTITVANTGATPTSAIGSGGAATWNQSGGTAIFAGQLVVQWFASAPATINLSGGTFSAGSGGLFQFGQNNSATTWNQSGGNAIFGASGVHMSLGSGPSTMTISNGTLSSTGNFVVGAEGSGLATLTVTNTGIVSLSQLQLGFNSGANKGLVNLDGGTLQIGASGVTFGGSGTSAGTLSFNGGTFLANAASVAIANNASLHTIVNAGGAVFNTPSGNTLTVNAALTDGGSGGGLSKSGAGTLTLANANTYTGSTIVNAGTLIVSTSGGLANNDSSKVFEQVGGNTFSSTTPTLIRTVTGVSFNSTAYGSQSLGSLGTKADLVDSYTVSRTVTTEWRTVNSVTDITPPGFGLVSDVLRLGGLNGTNFVLQMSYSSDAFDKLAGNGGVYLGWWDVAANTWTNAVAGNTGGTAHFAGIGAYTSALDFNLGTWGVDTNANVVWAVLNHNSDFGVLAVPEPSTIFLFACGGLAIWQWLRRRSRLNKICSSSGQQ